MQFNILEAKNRFSTLIAAAEREEEVIIARNGVPVAKIIKYNTPKISLPGAWKDRVPYSEEWNTTVTNTEIEDLFDDAPFA